MKILDLIIYIEGYQKIYIIIFKINMSEENTSQELRLKKIDEIKKLFH